MKKWILRIIVVLLGVFLLLGLIPFGEEIHYHGTACEFALASDGAVAEHEVIIDGTYYSSLFLKDRFWGTFYISDVEGLPKDSYVDFSFEPKERYHPVFLGEGGYPHSTEISVIFFDRNFERLAIQLAYKYERTETSITSAYGDGESNFLVIGAEDRYDALTQYTKLLEEKR